MKLCEGVILEALKNLYSGNYRRFLIVPLILLIVFGFLAFVFPRVPTGIDLSGGTLIILRSETALDAKETEQLLNSEFELTDLSVVSTSSPLGGYGLTIRFAKNAVIAAAEQELAAAKAVLSGNEAEAISHAETVLSIVQPYIEPVELSQDAGKAVQQAAEAVASAKEALNNRIQQGIVEHFNLGSNVAFQKKEISPTLGSAFYRTALTVIIFGIILVAVVIFIFFRKVLPSAAVLASAFLDVVGALGLMAIFNIPLTLSSIPALLMLIGYSVDTDVMLTTKVLQRREHEPRERIYDAMITGLTMNATTIAALAAMLVLSFFAQMFVVYEIAIVLIFGLLIDLSSTWFMNAPVLLWYVERERKKHE